MNKVSLNLSFGVVSIFLIAFMVICVLGNLYNAPNFTFAFASAIFGLSLILPFMQDKNNNYIFPQWCMIPVFIMWIYQTVKFYEKFQEI
jgi:hypothetical protein